MSLGNKLSGAAALASWWLKGHKPVDFYIARARARACVACPMNEPEGLFNLEGRVGELFKAGLEQKHALNLKLPQDEKLGVCEACGCPLKLKVWSPREVLFEDGKPEYFDKLWEKCWMRQM